MPLFKIRGVHVPHNKNTASQKAVKMPNVKEVVIPMAMHIGAPATPIVKVGQRVLVGEKIAEATSYISAPIHASVSGKVKKIDNILMSNGNSVPAVFIESDGLMEVSPACQPVEVNTFEEFISAVKESGIVGLGGAGFPTYVKLNVKDLSQIEEVVINGAECEPFITADTRTMIDDVESIKEGVELLKRFLNVKKVIFGVEDNKPEAIQALQKLAKEDSVIKVHALKAEYPQGGEKVLIYNTTGKVVPEGKLPLDVGVVIMNVTTLAFIAKYIKTGMPLVEKVLTVDGSVVACSKNVIAPIGASMKEVFEFCGGFVKTPYKVIYGGPMMGIAVPNLNQPILKTTNAIVALSEKEAHVPEAGPCIRCGRCINQCPLRLDPPAICKARELNDGAELERLKANLCMECGVCSFVCPAKRPIVQSNKLAKGVLRTYQTQKKEANK